MVEANFVLLLQHETVHEHDLTYHGVGRQLLRRLHAHLDLLRRSKLFAAPPRESALLADEELKEATDRAIDRGLVAAIARATGETETTSPWRIPRLTDHIEAEVGNIRGRVTRPRRRFQSAPLIGAFVPQRRGNSALSAFSRWA